LGVPGYNSAPCWWTAPATGASDQPENRGRDSGGSRSACRHPPRHPAPPCGRAARGGQQADLLITTDRWRRRASRLRPIADRRDGIVSQYPDIPLPFTSHLKGHPWCQSHHAKPHAHTVQDRPAGKGRLYGPMRTIDRPVFVGPVFVGPVFVGPVGHWRIGVFGARHGLVCAEGGCGRGMPADAPPTQAPPGRVRM